MRLSIEIVLSSLSKIKDRFIHARQKMKSFHMPQLVYEPTGLFLVGEPFFHFFFLLRDEAAFSWRSFYSYRVIGTPLSSRE